MTTEQITQIVEWIIAILPSVIAVLTTIGVIIKTLKEFASLKSQVVDLKALDDLKGELKQLVQENYELKKTLNETMTIIDRVKRGE